MENGGQRREGEGRWRQKWSMDTVVQNVPTIISQGLV